MTKYFAHSANKVGKKHTLEDHLLSVKTLVHRFLANSNLEDEASLAGMLHDFGKYGDLFQDRLQGKERGIDHWSLGAWLALQNEYKAIAAALAVEGHHIGLQNLNRNHFLALNPKQLTINHPLQLRLSENNLDILKSRLTTDGIEPTIAKKLFGSELTSTVGSMLDVRMIFSALVDADFLDTEAHFEGTTEGKRYRQEGPKLQGTCALEILLKHIKDLQAQTKAAPEVSKTRATLLDACLRAADTSTGLFTLTAPTGSGKTLAMLAFALKHAIAQKRKLRRIVIVLPYLSIIEQTASIYREIFESHFGPHYVLEHHSLADVGFEKTRSDSEGKSGEQEASERQRRLLAENWDAPLIVTTSVQMLESLFSNRPSACRKLHHLMQSVIMFDEVQTLPVNLTLPTLAALSHLAHNYHSTVVLSTATQPAFEHLHENVKSYSVSGWKPKEIIPEAQSLFADMKRVHVSWDNPDKGTSWDELTERLKKHSQVLCIVNIKRHARIVWEKIGEGVFHLSTNLCPAHRRSVLGTISEKLPKKQPVRLIATQCIEAGVDVDFPVVYRAYAPLDAITQAAGRCNREGRQDGLGQVHVFQPLIEGNENEYPDSGYEQAAQVTKMLFKRYGAEKMHLDNPDFIMCYYRELYDISRPETMERTRRLKQYIEAGSFPDIAKEYRLVKQDAINILVPYQLCIEEFEKLLDEGDKIGLTAEWIRRARPLTISIYRPKPEDIIWYFLIPVKMAGRKDRERSDWFIYNKKEDYHPVLGLIPSGTPNIWIA